MFCNLLLGGFSEKPEKDYKPQWSAISFGRKISPIIPRTIMAWLERQSRLLPVLPYLFIYLPLQDFCEAPFKPSHLLSSGALSSH